MIIEIVALVNKRTQAILVKPCMYIIASCVLVREHGSCAHPRSFPPKPLEAVDQGHYAYYEDPDVDEQGSDEE